MEHLREPTLLDFLMQVIAYTVVIPLTYFGYRWVRAPLKKETDDTFPRSIVVTRFMYWGWLGAIIGTGLGTFLRQAGVPFDANLATISIIAFFTGFFPEQGVNWVVATAQKALKQQGGIVKEITLSNNFTLEWRRQ